MPSFFFVQPSSVRAPSFSPILDGKGHTCTLLWNVSAQRFYLSCKTFSNVLVCLVPVIGSDPGILLNSLTWDIERQIVNGECSKPHRIPLGTVIKRTIQGAFPIDYNGTFEMLITGASSFSYSQPTFPGNPSIDFQSDSSNSALVAGSLNHLINIFEGYFKSTVVYRSGQFEISP